MRITNPFVVIQVTDEGVDRFQGVVAGLQGENRPPWAGWVLDGLRRTRVERDGNGALYWFRGDGDLPNDLPRDPAPGITVYAPGDDAPTETDPATVRDAHLLLGVVLARFVRRLAEGREGEGAVLTPATEPEPRAAAEPEPAPEAQRAEPAPARGGQPELPPGEEPAPVTPPRIRSSVPPTPIPSTVRQRIPEKYAAIPAAMREAARWVVWQYEVRDGKRTKVPHTPGKGQAKSTDPATWVTFEEACQAEEFYSGIGFVLGDGWLGLDADHVRDPDTGEWLPGILDEIKSVQSYAELSPSKTGAHVITFGTKPGDRSRAAGEVWEMYDRGRFFTVTGDHIPGTPLDVREPAPGSLEAIYEKIGRTKEMQQAPRAKTPTPRSTAAPDLTDAEIIEKCQSAANAAKFNALWRGDTSGYGSHSEADLALCSILAFYSQDPAQLERLVRQSGLYREKWDRTDYVTRTISKALEHVGETWSPGRRDALKTYIRQEGEGPVTTPPPQDPATMPATEAPPTSTPRPVTPGRGDTRPTPTSSVTVSLIEGIKMEIAAAAGGGWVTRFTRNGDTLTEDRSGAEPWIDRRAPGRLTKALAAAVPTLNEKAIKDAITAKFDGIRESPDGAALISEPAARVINATKAVTVEMCDPPVYRVELIDGAILTFSNRDMAALQPVTLNDRWLAVHPGDPLKANRRDFEEIQEYWFSILEKVDPAGNGSVWESIAADLQFAIAGREAGSDKISLLKTGVYQEPGGPLWVSGRVIAEVLRKAARNENDPGLSQFLKRRGDLIEPSKPFRVSRILIRAWGFSPDFMPEVDETAGPMDFSPDGEDL